MMVHDYFLDINRKMEKEELIIYNVGFGESFSGYTYGYDRRDYYLLEYTLQGNGQLNTDKSVYPVRSNEGFLIPPDTTFRITNEQKWILCWIGFYGPHIDRHLEEAHLLNKQTPVFQFDDNVLIESCIENIYHKARKSQVSNATLFGELYILLGHLAERGTKAESGCTPLSYFEKANYFINKNILKKPTVDQLILEYDVSPAQLYRSFKAECGMSPKQYIDMKKIEKACELMENTTLSFHQISSVLGYEHESAFFQTFKRVKGNRPSEYKSLHCHCSAVSSP